MKKIKVLLMTMMVCVGAMTIISCDNSKTYAEKLADEKDAIKFFVNEQGIKAITIDEDAEAEYYKQRSFKKEENKHFELGQWYKVKHKNDMYFQILDYGNKNEMFGKPDGYTINNNDIIIRYDSCYNLKTYNDLSSDFSSNWNYNLYYWNINPWVYGSVSTYGVGLDFIIPFIGDKGKVRLIIPSKSGMTADQSNVIPYYYHIVQYKAAGFPAEVE